MSIGVERDETDGGGRHIRSADADPAETQEWLDSVDAVVDHAGRRRARELMLSVLARAEQRHVILPGYGDTRLRQHDPGHCRATVSRQRGHRAPDPCLHPLERGDDGAPSATAGSRRRRTHLDLRLDRHAVRGGVQPLLPGPRRRRRRRPDLLPGPRVTGHLRARLPRGTPERGPSGRVPSGGLARRAWAAASRRTPTRVSCPTSGSSPLSPWAWARSARSTRPGSTATSTTAASRTPVANTCGRSSATARWTSPRRWEHSASPPGKGWTTSPSSSTATCNAWTDRCAATARSSRSSSPTSVEPAGTSSRSSGDASGTGFSTPTPTAPSSTC